MDLPPRQRAAEDAWIEEWAAEGDPEAMVDAITALLEERRPRLAARLFGLLEEHVEIEPGSPLEQARAASRLVLVSEDPASESAWIEMETAWAEARRRRMIRIQSRMRAARRSEQVTVPRVGRRPRKHS